MKIHKSSELDIVENPEGKLFRRLLKTYPYVLVLVPDEVTDNLTAVGVRRMIRLDGRDITRRGDLLEGDAVVVIP